MDYSLTEETTTVKRDPPLWMLALTLIMIACIGVFAMLPPYLTRHNFEKYNNSDKEKVDVVKNSDAEKASVTAPTVLKNSDAEKASVTAPTVLKNSDAEKASVAAPTVLKNSHAENASDVAPTVLKNSHADNASVVSPKDHGDVVTEPPGSSHPLLVKTQDGDIHGVESDGVRIFHGVPYAQPPVGPLRWKAPKKVKPWSPGVHDATFMRDGCAQRCHKWKFYCPRNTSEDCLYLEIYTPLNASSASRFPVLVYIHGGGFDEMSTISPIYNSTYLVKEIGIVIVLIEYRLGAFGFLVSADAQNKVSGNFGILDQAMALEWVQNNVEAFGGDPDKITLAGQSAGSQSVLIHLQSPITSQKFRSIILESPPLSLAFKTISQALKQTKKFANIAGCKSSEKISIIACLRNLDTEDILDAQVQITTFGSSYLSRAQPWGPCVDNKTVLSQLMEAFESAAYDSKPTLWGVTAEEALVFVREWFTHPTNFLTYHFAKSIVGKGMNPTKLDSLYPAKSKDSRDDIAVLATDLLFRCPVHWASQKLHDNGIDTVWSYVWHKTLTFPKSHFGYICNDRSCHGVELPYVFHNFDLLDANVTAEDITLSDLIVDYYGNFIKYDDPNGKQDKAVNNKDSLPHWPKAYTSGHYQTLGFHKNGSVGPEKGVLEDRCNLWIDNNFKLRR